MNEAGETAPKVGMTAEKTEKANTEVPSPKAATTRQTIGKAYNDEAAAKIGNTVQHLGEIFPEKYQNGQGIDAMRSSVPTSTDAVRINTVNPFKSLK